MLVFLQLSLWLARSKVAALDRLRFDERGEGVISSAIAVLVMAFLGAAMWLAFKGMFATTTDNTRSQVELIGR